MRKNITKQFVAVAIATSMVFSNGFIPLRTSYIQAAAEQAAENAIITNNYQFDKESDWDKAGDNDGDKNLLGLKTLDVPAEGTTLNMDVLLPAGENGQAPSYDGKISPVGVLRLGSDWTWVQSNTIPELSAADFKDTVEIKGKTYYKKSVSIPFADTVGANDANGWNGSMAFADAVKEAVNNVTVQMIGKKCDYSGDISIANASLTNTEGAAKQTVVKEWNFDDNKTDSWDAVPDWNYQYNGQALTVAAKDGRLKVDADYSKDGDNSWAQACIGRWGDVDLTGTNKLSIDFYYDSNTLGKGGFSVKATVQAQDGEKYPTVAENFVSVDTTNAEDAGNGLKKATVVIPFDQAISGTCCNVVLGLVGVNTSYEGSLYLDNIKMIKEEVEDVAVDSTKKVDAEKKNVAISENQLVTVKGDKTEQKTGIAKEVALVDKGAKANTKAVYSYLKAMGESDSVIYGHQNDTWRKAGSDKLSNSDTKDVTGSISGIVGIDALSLTGAEYSAEEYNDTHEDAAIAKSAKGNVEAAAKLTNENIADGAIITMSAHMPNFAFVKTNENYKEGTDPTYAKYDFSGYSPDNLKGDTMNEILPGGKYNDQYIAYLDMIADYASQVEGTVLFRPFHENTGSWFWWGAAFCDESTYKNVWKYTVEYLRDTKNVHNFLYVYGPGSEASSTQEYGKRYPGDDYVDMVGCDIYNDSPSGENTEWFKALKSSVKIVEDFAKDHNKLVALTETGIRNDVQKGENQTALLKKGNADMNWYNKVLNAISDSSASYFLLWANFGKQDGYYTPYVDKVNKDGTLHGHETLDSFIDFYNDGRSVFAAQQKEVLATANTLGETIAAASKEAKADGYIVSPVGRKRILDAVTVKAKLNNVKDTDKITVKFNAEQSKEAAAVKDGDYYTASLTKEEVQALGAKAGTIELCVNGTVVDSVSVIFNIEKPKEDPYEIDGFENYFGVDSLLTQEWTTNKAAGSNITLSVNSDKNYVYDGDYSMKFDYEETSAGWAGATIKKEVDWSKCNALQFYTVPDGNNQKVVIQITANGTVYEVYLNDYEEYKNTTKPVLVTIPFAEFCERDTDDHPKGGLVENVSKIESVGLWVNAIEESDAVKNSEDGMVRGTIYYDKITAVNSNAKAPAFAEPVKKEDSNNNGNEGADNNASGNANSNGNTNIGNNTNSSANTGNNVTNNTAANNSTQTSKKVSAVKKNAVVKVGKNKYKVTSTSKKTVAYKEPTSKKVTGITIPATVKIKGKTYKVTSISEGAFQKCSKLKSVTIGKNITSIGKKAFSGCKNVKKITIKSKSIKTVGANAFKGIHKNTKIKVPSSKVKAYKKLFKGKGQSKTVKITK